MMISKLWNLLTLLSIFGFLPIYAIDYNNTKTNDINPNRQIMSSQDKEAEGRMIARRTLKLGSSESCEWNEDPVSLVKGHLCGAYYKILGLDRSLGKLDRNGVKKAYRAKSLQLHPDKNPAPEASAAFKLLTDAYECLSEDTCQYEYEQKLLNEEYAIQAYRNEIKETVIQNTKNAAAHVHYYISLAASHVYSFGLDVWEFAGDIEMELFGATHKVGQYALMSLLIFTKARIILYAQGISYLISKLNYELAKQQGMF